LQKLSSRAQPRRLLSLDVLLLLAISTFPFVYSAVVISANDGIVDVDADVSSGFIYWMEFAERDTDIVFPKIAQLMLKISRVRPDGFDVAPVVVLPAFLRLDNASALAINWLDGSRICHMRH